MIQLRYILALIAFIAMLFCAAQTTATDSTGKQLEAGDYFNSAGKEYIKEQKIDALKTLDKGLKAHPGDPRLLKLAEELIKEEQQKQQQQQQQQQQKQEQQKGEQQEQKQGEKGDEKKESEKEQGEQNKPNEKEKGNEDRSEAGRISEKDAERILDAMEREEKDVQKRVRENQRITEPRSIDKDW